MLLRQRAERLSLATGRSYRSKFEKDKKVEIGQLFKTALSRPWALLFKEPVVFLLSLYLAIVYATLYVSRTLLATIRAYLLTRVDAFRCLSNRLPAAARMVTRCWWTGFPRCLGRIHDRAGIHDLLRKSSIQQETQGRRRMARPRATSSTRYPWWYPLAYRTFNFSQSVITLLMNQGLFSFAWTAAPARIHWIAPIICSAPFGCGMVLVFLSCFNYLIDGYLLHAASVLAANSVLRSLFGVGFPLFVSPMFKNLGVNWACTLIAFLALACAPLPL